ncbi:PTS glucitol/sorbitol transporter subunit IIA [Halanaerobium sp.]|uniref:PTS glucitol/sorbitol transporter subunit IIA n=1 Tax=Halanaerobium sp. TaxID=1895664 RepID=UPI0025C3EE5A|nr:PTS glucitol/sorbitol transporter subunit IIA [Halanaerobium sp.]
MNTIYKTVINEIGDLAGDMIDGNLIILYKTNAPAELAEISVMHEAEFKKAEIEAGDILEIGNQQFEILAVGNVVNKNIENLGHCSLKFNGEKEVELPGDINLEQKEIPEIKIGLEIKIYKK